MASIYDVETALNSQMNAYIVGAPNSVGADNIAWGNVAFEPAEGQPYIAVNTVPASSTPVGVGQESAIRERGFYQLSVAVPSGEGKAVLRRIVEELQTYFRQGTSISYGGTSVRVQRFQIFNTISAPDWYIQIVRVEWRSDISNT